MIVIKSVLNLSNLKLLPSAFKDQARQAVRNVAIRMRDEMQANAPVDKGALATGIYAVTKEDNGGPEAAAAAAILRPEVVQLPLLSDVNSDYMSRIGLTQPYWPYVEYGTANTPAQPFVGPVVDQGQSWLMDEMSAGFIAAAQNAGFRVF